MRVRASSNSSCANQNHRKWAGAFCDRRSSLRANEAASRSTRSNQWQSRRTSRKYTFPFGQRSLTRRCTLTKCRSNRGNSAFFVGAALGLAIVLLTRGQEFSITVPGRRRSHYLLRCPSFESRVHDGSIVRNITTRRSEPATRPNRPFLAMSAMERPIDRPKADDLNSCKYPAVPSSLALWLSAFVRCRRA
jgi:hypothetical protein